MSTSRRGFAAMSPEKRREIASQGGKTVPAKKRSFSQNRDLAAKAGRKGWLRRTGRTPIRPQHRFSSARTVPNEWVVARTECWSS